MKLEGEKIYLKPFGKECAEDWVRWSHDEEIMRFTTVRPNSLEEELKFISDRENDPNADTIFSIFLKENDKVIGNCGIHKSKIKAFPNEITVGIVIGEKDEWGKGYGTDAMKTLLKCAKEQFGLTEVYLNVDTPNIPAQKCYRKCGFEIIGKEKSPEESNTKGEQYIMRVIL